jgi:LPS sulfotransferase NodH
LPRSGSWLLARGLQQTGLAGRPEEYFWDELRPFYTRRWGLPSHVSQPRFINTMLRFGTSSNGVFGAKVHWFQMRQLLARLKAMPQSWGHTARQLIEGHLPSPKYLHLIREDKVRQAISYQVALATGEWWAGRTPGSMPRAEEVVDYDAVERLEALLIDHEQKWSRYFAHHGISPLVVTYEELCVNYGAVIRKILRHLELDLPRGFRAGPPPLTKQANGRTEDIVHDYLTYQRASGRSPPPPNSEVYGRGIQRQSQSA